MPGYERVAVDAEWKWQEEARAEFQMVLTFPAPVMGDNTLPIYFVSVEWECGPVSDWTRRFGPWEDSLGQRLDWESSEY